LVGNEGGVPLGVEKRNGEVAQDRRLAENRPDAKRAYGGGSMSIRGSLTIALVLALLAPPSAGVAQSQRIFRVGYLGGGPPSPPQPTMIGFVREIGRASCRERGRCRWW